MLTTRRLQSEYLFIHRAKLFLCPDTPPNLSLVGQLVAPPLTHIIGQKMTYRDQVVKVFRLFKN